MNSRTSDISLNIQAFEKTPLDDKVMTILAHSLKTIGKLNFSIILNPKHTDHSELVEIEKFEDTQHTKLTYPESL